MFLTWSLFLYKRKKVYSIKNELLKKSREAMLATVEIYNNPNISFIIVNVN